MQSLPDELISAIFGFIDIADWFNIRATCKRFYLIGKSTFTKQKFYARLGHKRKNNKRTQIIRDICAICGKQVILFDKKYIDVIEHYNLSPRPIHKAEHSNLSLCNTHKVYLMML